MDIGGEHSRALTKLMAASALRDRVISSNIANQNVPGYQRQYVRFEELLRDKLAHGDPNYLATEPEVLTDRISPAGPDGNNVSLELETNAARENRLLFELYAAIFQGRMDMVQAAITQSR